MSTIDSLAALMLALKDEPIENPQAYSYLNEIDVLLLQARIAAFKLIEAEVRPAGLTGKAAKQWESERNGRKGVAFESILSSMLSGRCFAAWQRLQTDTNELDFLVALELMAGIVPVFQTWGTHFICECKSTESYSNTWLQKLYAILNLHNAKVGVVFSRKRPSKVGNGSRAHSSMIKIALLGKVIMTFDIEDAEACATGTSFLVILRNRFIEVNTGVNQLRTIAGS